MISSSADSPNFCCILPKAARDAETLYMAAVTCSVFMFSVYVKFCALINIYQVALQMREAIPGIFRGEVSNVTV
jgi:hypothetical protein